MEIKSIKKIKNIGVFRNFENGGKFRFENKITFVFGLNTYGKTTLTDIFQSLKDNNPEIIESRKTIPIQEENQKVVLSVKENNKEKDLKFENNKWEENNLSKNIEVFGTEFIYKNLFTGLSIERENKENFTDFILGEEGVEIAKKIEDDKKNLGQKKRDIKKLLPYFVKNKKGEEIEKFLKFDISDLDKDKIEEDLLKFKTKKQKEEKRLQEPQKILNLESPTKIEIPNFTILENLEKINNYLQKNYSNIKEEFLQSLNKHISENFQDQTIAEDWIKQGFQNIKDKNGNCLFCGQPLTNAKNIIDLYDKYFDEKYSNFITEIEEGLQKELKNLENVSFDFQNKFRSQYVKVLKFKDFISEQSFQDLLSKFEKKLEYISDDNLENKKKLLIQTIKEKIELKNKKPYISIDKISFDEFKKNFQSYITNLSELNNLIEEIEKDINNFKKQYEDTSKIKDLINELEKEIKDLEYKKARIEQDKDCKIYLQKKQDIEDLEKRIKENRKKLKDAQTNYLDKYFNKINELFKKFGSHDFALERKEENYGNKPVYSLKVKFHGKEITNEQMKKVFSESDRRALALAIFWAKIELKDEKEKQKTIIILDDPITSFDNNRTLNFIYYLKDNLPKVSQIIIFTHYSKFLSDYKKYTKEKPMVYKIIREGKLDNFDLDALLKSDYIKILEEIQKFSNGKIDKIDLVILRNFIDLYRPIFSGIVPDNVINDIYTECCTFNHNNFNNEEEIENIRNFVKEMLKKLYSFEYKKNNQIFKN